MAGFLDDYGVEEERRSRFIRRLVLVAVTVAAVSLGIYLTLRTWPAKSRVRDFLADLAHKDYKAAYGAWDCAKPCKDYTFDKFLSDWGPKTEFGASAADTSIKRARVCSSGDILVTIVSPKGTEMPLMYNSRERAIGFAPWPICDPHVPPPSPAP